ncbi:hypothetical protein BJ170DRAFT_46338 [Xylariales sp. AK1849]|nr:hypothetical protein BJ170DRAFT_46338 [Xylariales sp. AK1849]
MSRYEDRGRRHDRDRSPDYVSGGSGMPQPPYSPSDIPYRVPSPGHTSYYPPNNSQARIAYEPQAPFYPPPSAGNNLQVPDSRARPRSLPPPADWRGRSRHGRDYEEDEDDDDITRDRSPIAKARNALKDTFSDSRTGLGVGVLGALVGGLAAREAAEATSRHGGGHRATEAQKRNQLLSTVVGAAVGALGANAVERRIEHNREKGKVEQKKWEQKWGKAPAAGDSRRPGSRGSGGGYRSGEKGGMEVFEKREVVKTTRPRTRSGDRAWKKDWDWEDARGRGAKGVEREIDPDARSWKDVEDWVYDDRDRSRDKHRDKGRRSEDGYRF